jgi:hypothetical protein
MAKIRDAMEIYREAMAEIPRSETTPPVIQRAEAWPYPELDRLWVRLETGGFVTFPNLDLTLFDSDGQTVSTLFLVEIREPYQSLTMHLRRPPQAGRRYSLEIVLSRAGEELDRRMLEFPLEYRDPAVRSAAPEPTSAESDPDDS